MEGFSTAEVVVAFDFFDEKFRQDFARVAIRYKGNEHRLAIFAEKKFRGSDKYFSKVEQKIISCLANRYNRGASLNEASVETGIKSDWTLGWFELMGDIYPEFIKLTAEGRYAISSYPYLLYWAKFRDSRWDSWARNAGAVAFGNSAISLFMKTIAE